MLIYIYIFTIVSKRPDLLLRKFKVRDPRVQVPPQHLVSSSPPVVPTEMIYTTTLLHEALVASSSFTLPLLKNIFERFPDLGDGILTSVDDQGWSVLHFVAGKASKADGVLSFLIEKGKHYKKHVLFYITRGADVNFVDSNGRTCVHVALQRDDCDFVQDLIKAACDDEYDFSVKETTNGWTVLHCCAWSTVHSNLAYLLVERGANPNEVDNQGNTPLMLALQREQYSSAASLITNKNVNKPNNAGLYPIILSMRQCNTSKPREKKKVKYNNMSNYL